MSLFGVYYLVYVYYPGGQYTILTYYKYAYKYYSIYLGT